MSKFSMICLMSVLVLGTACQQFKTSGGSNNTDQSIVTPTCGSTATLTWTTPTQNTDGSALTDLSGFNVYYGGAPSTLGTEINIPNATLNTYIIKNLAAGTYYFAMTAYNSSALESDKTNTVELILANCAEAKVDLITGK